MNTVTVRILTILLSLFAIITVSSQIYMRLHRRYTTQTAAVSSSATMETFFGVFVRDESPVSYSGGGAVSYPMPDGGKAANGSVLAYIYGSEDDIIVNTRIERLQKEIALLESAQSPGTTEVAQPEFLSDLISERYQTIATDLAKKDLSELSDNKSSFLSLMNIYQISIGEAKNFNARTDALYRELNSLESRRAYPKKEITSDRTGYFVSFADGYENMLNTETIDDVGAEQIKQIITDENSGNKKTPAGCIGKLINGYGWKMLGIINNSENTYSAGDKVKLRFASTSDTVFAVIEKITDTDNPEESIIKLDCDEMTFDLVKHRVEHVEMILHDYEGIKVPREALRFNRKNEKGVYILMGQRVLFRKLDIIFECDDYLLSRLTSDTSYVNVYDDIIISGVDTAGYILAEEELSDEKEQEEEEIPIYTGPVVPQTEDDGKKPETSFAEETESDEE